MDDLPATPIRSPRSPGKKLTLAEDEVARLRARLEEEEAWQAKILKRLEAKAAEDKKNESKYESTARPRAPRPTAHTRCLAAALTATPAARLGHGGRAGA